MSLGKMAFAWYNSTPDRVVEVLSGFTTAELIIEQDYTSKIDELVDLNRILIEVISARVEDPEEDARVTKDILEK